jgi:DNA-3-methyladenine glycosylase I
MGKLTNEYNANHEKRNTRCDWCLSDPIYIQYHDEEWGKECHDDKILFEFLILESAQAGLSWLTVLKKRAGYRKAFANFDAKKVAQFDEAKIEALLQFEGIIRNRLKIKSAISNAQIFLSLQKEYGSFDAYLYSFMPNNKPIINKRKSLKDLPASSVESDAISKDLKKRGFKFFGSTICYAHMQATGMVNDHLITCHCY